GCCRSPRWWPTASRTTFIGTPAFCRRRPLHRDRPCCSPREIRRVWPERRASSGRTSPPSTTCRLEMAPVTSAMPRPHASRAGCQVRKAYRSREVLGANAVEVHPVPIHVDAVDEGTAPGLVAHGIERREERDILPALGELGQHAVCGADPLLNHLKGDAAA